jgi:hypothetical protein
MKLSGSHKVSAPRDRAFHALTDPAVLQECIPGCQEMEKTGDNQYKATLSAGIGPVKGVFAANITLRDIVAPEHFTLVVEGKGQPGFVKGTGTLNLSEDDGSTAIQYSGEVNIGGMIASVGQRMIQATANLLAGRFFKALQAELHDDKHEKKD